MHGAVKAIAGLELALAKLQLEYIDLFLIHTPMGRDVTATWQVSLHQLA